MAPSIRDECAKPRGPMDAFSYLSVLILIVPDLIGFGTRHRG